MEHENKTPNDPEDPMKRIFALPPGLDISLCSSNTRNDEDSPSSVNSEPHSRWESPQVSSNSRKILRQSAYIISIISERSFIQRGAVPLNYGLYYIRKECRNTPDAETLALVGIPIIHIAQFFVEESELVRELRKSPQLQYIDNVAQLSVAENCNVLRKFVRFFENCDSSMLLLLNIEPRGEGRYKRLYPYPRFTIPGGTMESQDMNDFLQCALREFREETSLDVTDNYEIISQKKVVRDIRSSNGRRRQVFNYYNDKPCKIISKYFFIRIRF